MAGKIVPSGGLSAASNPSARLQELLRHDSNTEKNTDLHTEAVTSLIPETITDLDVQENTETPPSIRPQKRKSIKTEGVHPTNTSGFGNISVRQRIVEDLQKEPVVRKTIDIPASLNERLQDYCAAKRIKTERRVFLVLLENFLEEEGF